MLSDKHQKIVKLYNETLKKATYAPYVIIDGQSIFNYDKIFLIIDEDNIKNTYAFDCFFEAFDALFKIIKGSKRDYPKLCSHVWQFIEYSVYDFKSESIYSVVANLLRKLELEK